MEIEILHACKEGVGNVAGPSYGSHHVISLQKSKPSLLLWSVYVVRLSGTLTVNLNHWRLACCHTVLHTVIDLVAQLY